MIVKRGVVVSHIGAIEWGIGKVVEVTTLRATIQFSDGVIRKIASSHYSSLIAANPTLYVPALDSISVEKVRVTSKKR